MPKEIIAERPIYFEDVDGNEDLESGTQGLVEISWNSEAEHVQLVTYERAMVTYDRTFEGRYVTMDRYMINQLIRHLRRARDQAFGRDE